MGYSPSSITLTVVVVVCVASLLLYYHAGESTSNRGGTTTSASLLASLRRLEEAGIVANETATATGKKKEKDFALARTLAKRVLNLIHHRYELGGPIGSNFFLTANNMKEETWDIMKWKFAKKMVSSTDNKFLMIFGGSSVTAAHDNFYNQSYPATVHRRMGPIFDALNIDIEVNNIAQGANNCSPYTLCYESMGKLDADFIGWEQSYNCGHDEAIFELAARIAGFSARKGVVYYSASGAWAPNTCPDSTDKPPFSNEDWTPESASLEPWEVNLQQEKDLLNAYAMAKLSASRFAGFNDRQHDYRAVSPHGFNVWENNNLCKGRDKEDTKDITGCNGMDAAQNCKLRFMTKEAAEYGNEGGRGANWHPTRAFHMLRGEAITWLYTLALLDSINMVENDLVKRSIAPEELEKQYTAKLLTLQPPMPKEPKKCQSYHCEVRPVCYTDYKPHYASNMTLTEMVVGTTSWEYEDEAYGDWSLHYGYLDAKPLWQAKGKQGEIHLKIDILKTDFVWVCGAVKESLMHSVIYLDPNVKLPANVSEYVPSEKREKWEKRKYMGNECKQINGLPVGSHVLSVSTENAPDTHTTGLSHLILWP